MFFKGRREKKELIFQQELDNLAAWFQERMGDVEQAAGVDEKLLRLEELRADIDDRVSGKQTEITMKVVDTGAKAGLGTLGLQAAAITGAVIATGGALAPLYFLTLPSMLGSVYAGEKAEKSAKKRLEREAAGFMSLLEEQRAAVIETENRLLENNMEAFAKSPLRDELFEDFPDLKSRFADVAARKAADPERDNAPKRKSIFDSPPKP